MYVKQQNSTFRENMHERKAAKCSPQESTILAKEADSFLVLSPMNETTHSTQTKDVSSFSMKRAKPMPILIKYISHNNKTKVKHINYLHYTRQRHTIRITPPVLPTLSTLQQLYFTSYHITMSSISTVKKMNPLRRAALSSSTTKNNAVLAFPTAVKVTGILASVFVGVGAQAAQGKTRNLQSSMSMLLKTDHITTNKNGIDEAAGIETFVEVELI